MKKFLKLMAIAVVMTSCANGTFGIGGWPARTRDKNVLINDREHYLSEKDVQAIHDVVWTKDPNLRVLSIDSSRVNRVTNQRVVLVTCTYQKGERFSQMQGFELIRQGDTWKFGSRQAKMNVSPM